MDVMGRKKRKGIYGSMDHVTFFDESSDQNPTSFCDCSTCEEDAARARQCASRRLPYGRVQRGACGHHLPVRDGTKDPETPRERVMMRGLRQWEREKKNDDAWRWILARGRPREWIKEEGERKEQAGHDVRKILCRRMDTINISAALYIQGLWGFEGQSP